MLSKKAAGLIGLGATMTGAVGSQMTSAAIFKLMEDRNEAKAYREELIKVRNISAAKNVVKRMCEILPSGERAQVFRVLVKKIGNISLNDDDLKAIESAGTKQNDNRLEVVYLESLKKIIDNIFEEAKTQGIDGAVLVKSLMEEVKLDEEGPVLDYSLDDVDDSEYSQFVGYKNKVQNKKFQDTVLYRNLFNDTVSEGSPKIFDNKIISDDMEDEYYRELFKLEDNAFLADVSQDENVSTDNVGKDLNMSMHESFNNIEENDEENLKIRDFMSDSYNANQIGEVADPVASDFSQKRQKVKKVSRSEKILNVDEIYKNALRNRGMTEDQFLLLQQKDPQVIERIGVAYNQVVTNGGNISNGTKRALLDYLEEVEKNSVEDYYSNSFNGRVAFLNDSGYKDSSIKQKIIDFTLEASKSALNKIASTTFAGISGPVGSFLVGLVTDIAIEYVIEEINDKLVIYHDKMHPELEKVKKLITDRIKEKFINKSVGTLTGLATNEIVSSIKDFVPKLGEAITKVSEYISQCFGLNSEKAKDVIKNIDDIGGYVGKKVGQYTNFQKYLDNKLDGSIKSALKDPTKKMVEEYINDGVNKIDNLAQTLNLNIKVSDIADHVNDKLTEIAQKGGFEELIKDTLRDIRA